jgi:hypothetical protein
MPDIQPLCVVMDSRNKPGFVPADIKHGKPAYLVSTLENTSQLCEVAKLRVLNNPVPGIQSS